MGPGDERGETNRSKPSGYEISEAEFASLFADAATARRLRRILAAWGLGIDPADPSSIGVAHSRIQNDPARQRAVYQVAMDLWR